MERVIFTRAFRQFSLGETALFESDRAKELHLLGVVELPDVKPEEKPIEVEQPKAQPAKKQGK